MRLIAKRHQDITR